MLQIHQPIAGYTNTYSTAALPDGIFSNKKYQFWEFLEGVGMENVGIFYGHFEYLTAIWYIL
jgi:hypothetical protein